jgi:hypothetical protein
MPLGKILKYALYLVAAGITGYLVYVILVERKGREVGQSVSGFMTNVGEGTAAFGYGVGYGIQSFMTQTAAGIRSWASLVTDMLNWFKSFAGGGQTVAYVPSGAASVHHQALYPTTFNIRTIQALREGR